MASVSSDVLWHATRGNNAFLLKARQIRSKFSVEPTNLSGIHRKKSSGLCNTRALGVTLAKRVNKSHQKEKKGKNATRRIAKLVVKGKKGFSNHTVSHGARHLVNVVKSLHLTATQRAEGLRLAAKIHEMR